MILINDGKDRATPKVGTLNTHIYDTNNNVYASS
jgi:hypothetical protein